MPRTVGYEVVVPLMSGAGRKVSKCGFELERMYSPRCARRSWLDIEVLQAVPSGHYHADPHSSYLPISPRTLRLAAPHLLAMLEPYWSTKTYVPVKDEIVKMWNWKRSRSSWERLMVR